MSHYRSGLIGICALACFSFAARAELADVSDPNEGKVAEEINDDRQAWLGEGIAKCTVDSRLDEVDATTMGYYYTQKPEHRHGYKKGYDKAVAKYRVLKLKCLQKVMTDEFGTHLNLKTALIFSDFREALGRLKGWGAYFQAQMPPTCPYDHEKIGDCSAYMTRMQKDAQMGWAMQRLAIDLEEQIKISTKQELGQAFERANRNLPKP
jgi:hypothetical protein